MSVTPMDFRHFTVAELKDKIKNSPMNLPAGFSKLRKAELIDALVRGLNEAEAWEKANQAEQELTYEEDQDFALGDVPELEYDTADAQVFQGAMHEATTPEAVGDTLRVLANSAANVAQALNTAGLAAQAAARKLAVVAWSHQVAVVHSMGHTVRGKVVDTVLREPGSNGMGRVCLVVQHDGHPTRRTLHALADVQFEALAS